MITFSCKNSVKNGNIHYIKYYSLLSQGDVKLAWNSSLYLLGILLTGNCYEPTYIIHVKQTLAVTNCWTRNKIVYLLQKQNRKSWRLWLKREPERVLDIGKTETVWCMSKIKGYPPPSYYCIFCEIKLLNFVRILNSWWTVWRREVYNRSTHWNQSWRLSAVIVE